ncbi:hypothetical protein [Egicoccus sp. AB-alg2]|uniref:hypothetical protein n=1 Tax=Egicoccus sp. AB-alg2 TaxID=3242693 RepID=UPI00359DD6D2
MTPPELEQQRPGRVDTGEMDNSTAMRLRRAIYRARRARLGRALAITALALIAGFLLGRETAPDSGEDIRIQLEQQALPLVFDADGIWTSGAGDRPSVSEALVALQRDEDPSLVAASSDSWLAAYDNVLARVAAIDVAPEGRPVQRQFVNGITLSRDAVVVLTRAAEIDDPDRRAGLLTEVARLRVRGEQIVQSARAGIMDLDGGRGDVSPLPELPDFPELGGE